MKTVNLIEPILNENCEKVAGPIHQIVYVNTGHIVHTITGPIKSAIWEQLRDEEFYLS